MELTWEDHPVPEGPFFSRDVYDKYSLAPNIRELWAFLRGPVENAKAKQECDDGAAKVSRSPSTDEAAEFKDNSCISSQASCWDSCDSEDLSADKAVESTRDFEDTKKSGAEQKQIKKDAPFPEPRLPYPCLSNISSKQQETFLGFLMNKKTKDPPEVLKAQVNNEVMHFNSYLQDVARMCADDYNFISQGAMQYSEEFLRSCLECIRTLPQFYQIHELTSLTGGTFDPGLALTFEKQLLNMGSVNITDHKIVPADAQLAWDYQSVSSENPPAKKAKDMHATVSGDGNAEKLCACYEPHVCLTRDALVRLLDNHGPEFVEQWELPVWVKLNQGKVGNQKKTVYIDSPLLKTEMTVRERSHIYHEESLKRSIKKNGSRNVFHLMTELPVNKQNLSQEISQRSVVSLENSGLDFEVDLTDLETFGETSKCKKIPDEQDGYIKSKKDTGSPLSKKIKTFSEETSSSSIKTNDSVSDPAQQVLSEHIQPGTEQARQDPALQSDEDQAFTGDSDDEKLVIDDSMSPVNTVPKQSKPQTVTCSADPPVVPASESTPESSEMSSPQRVTRARRQTKRAKDSGDQLGEILRMQTAMFKSANEIAKCSAKSPTRCAGPSVHSHPTLLVKPCVSSFLERNQSKDGETSVVSPKSSSLSADTKEHKKLLSQDLQATTEDEQDYEAPVEGNLFYKLYSLQDLLLMVRSSVSLTHTRKVGSRKNQHTPVHVLPKLEYQLSYGVECLTRNEVCNLWTETLLHSSTVSYIAHINAHTSKVALLRKLPDDWKQNISCGFKLSKSLNILHHLLKKLTGLEEGRYLIAHKSGEPFVTILKAAHGKGNRGGYDLHQVHSSVPQPPAFGFVPWIPVDPAVVLPFHQQHGRVPCTFPPTPIVKKTNGSNKKTRKQKKRTAKRNTYVKKLIQKSF
ncbi:little elongation complex subunit 2 [Pelmatolapia mariae]|uniref:little elongation complex subunit 2 n=1 Tax=Pelmatolapia mariae TaxID=158779 RepID=UPI002FE6267D